MKTPIIVKVWEIEEHPELWEHLDLDNDEYFQDDPSVLFEGDPDLLKVDNFITAFMDIDIKDQKYIITESDNEDDEYDILIKFFQSDFKEYFFSPTPNNWDAWDNLTTGIAYRGGKGYVYTIWNYSTPKNGQES